MKKIFLLAFFLLLCMSQEAVAATDFSDVNGTTITIHSIDEMTLLAGRVNGGESF